MPKGAELLLSAFCAKWSFGGNFNRGVEGGHAGTRPTDLHKIIIGVVFDYHLIEAIPFRNMNPDAGRKLFFIEIITFL